MSDKKSNFKYNFYVSKGCTRPVFRRKIVPESNIQAIVNLKETLVECIKDSLSNDNEVRQSAEQKITSLEVFDEYAVNLIELSLDKANDFASRQLSSVLLKQFINGHWNTGDLERNFVLQNRIRRHLLEGLREPISKLRNIFSHCIFYTCIVDYPNKWPTFFDDLHKIAVEDTIFGLHGVLRVYKDIISGSRPEQLNEIVGPVLEEICSILLDPEKYYVDVKTDAIDILCLIVKCSSQSVICVKLDSKLYELWEYFSCVLYMEDGDVKHYGFKTSIIHFFYLLIKKANKLLSPYLNNIVPVVCRMLQHYGDFYFKFAVHTSMPIMETENDEGILIGYNPLVISIFNFIKTIVNNGKINFVLHDTLNYIIYYLIIFMHIPKADERNWLANPFYFIEDIENDLYDDTLRITACDILKIICNDMPFDLVIPAFSQALNRHVSKFQWEDNEWKTHECIMLAMGTVQNIICQGSLQAILNFSLCDYTTGWLFTLNHPELPLLMGRALWYGGKFSPILSDNLFHIYLQAAVAQLNSSDVILKMFGLRAIICHIEAFLNNGNNHNILNYLPNIIQSILINIGKDTTVSRMFTLNLAALKLILIINTNYTELLENKITTILINIILKYYSDPDIVDEMCNIIKNYCSNEALQSVNLLNTFVPVLINIFNSVDGREYYAIQSVAMDLLQVIVQSQKLPLNDILVQDCFPALVNCVVNSDDDVVMMNGSECVRVYILLSAPQIYNFVSPGGKGGIHYILELINHILKPANLEKACTRIGRLIISCITKMKPVLYIHLPNLLGTILTKLHTVQQMEVWQSLLMVFIYLFYSETDSLINFLSSVPGSSGKSALEFILLEWLDREQYFVGWHDRVVSVAALVKILEFKETIEDPRFDTIMVPDTNVLQMSLDQDVTEVPVLGKIFKVICSEFANYMEKSTTPTSENNDESSFQDSVSSDISNFDDNEPDELAIVFSQDPTYGISLLPYLTEFIQKFKEVKNFLWYVGFLNCREKNALASSGVF